MLCSILKVCINLIIKIRWSEVNYENFKYFCNIVDNDDEDEDEDDDEDGERGTWSPFMRVSVDARRGVLAFSDHCPDNYDGI